jgi:hypothetical protein
MGRVVRQLKHGWNVFKNPPKETGGFYSGGQTATYRQQRTNSARYFNDRSIVASIYTRLSVDFSTVQFYHAILDDNDVAIEIKKDNFNNCITLDANVDQTAQALFQDACLTMFEEGVVAIVPTDADLDPSVTTSYDIKSMRAARIVGWKPRSVIVEVYDDREFDDEGNPVNGGITKQITLPKAQVAIIENPFYNVMNEPNGTLQRLKQKLAQLDDIDEMQSNKKLDIIFQLPYAVRGESRKAQAEKRRQDLREQLMKDELGIGYIDVSEKVIQLNRSITSTLPDEIKDLKEQIFADLGLTLEIMNGTANRDTINNYYDRTIEPIANAFALEMKRKFLTKTARTQGHSVEIYRDPLKLIPISELAEVADKLIRNAVVTTNEFRPKIGYRPSKDPAANQLKNPNMPNQDQGLPSGAPADPAAADGNDPLDQVNSMLDETLKQLDASNA